AWTARPGTRSCTSRRHVHGGGGAEGTQAVQLRLEVDVMRQLPVVGEALGLDAVDVHEDELLIRHRRSTGRRGGDGLPGGGRHGSGGRLGDDGAVENSHGDGAPFVVAEGEAVAEGEGRRLLARLP